MKSIAALSVLMLCSGLAWGQPVIRDPLMVAPPKAEPAKPPPAVPALKPDPLDDAYAASLNHPDVRAAMAEYDLAKAKLEQVKLKTAQAIAALRAEIDIAKVMLTAAEAKRNSAFECYTLAKQTRDIHAKAGTSQVEMNAVESLVQKHDGEYAAARNEIALAQARLARAESDYKSATVPFAALLKKNADTPYLSFPPAYASDAIRFRTSQETAPLAGSVTTKLRAVLDNRIKLPAGKGTFGDFLNALRKEAKLDAEVLIRVKIPDWDRLEVSWPAAEMTVIAWLQFQSDDINAELLGKMGTSGPYHIYVREYGLLITSKASAPADALTLQEFARQVAGPKPAEAK